VLDEVVENHRNEIQSMPPYVNLSPYDVFTTLFAWTGSMNWYLAEKELERLHNEKGLPEFREKWGSPLMSAKEFFNWLDTLAYRDRPVPVTSSSAPEAPSWEPQTSLNLEAACAKMHVTLGDLNKVRRSGTTPPLYTKPSGEMYILSTDLPLWKESILERKTITKRSVTNRNLPLEEVATELQVTVKTLRKWQRDGKFPACDTHIRECVYATWLDSLIEGREYNAPLSLTPATVRCTGEHPSPAPGRKFLYLLEHPAWGVQKIGITRDLSARLRTHLRHGWTAVDILGPEISADIEDTETLVKMYVADRPSWRDFSRLEDERFDGWTESWNIGSYQSPSIDGVLELLAKEGIKVPLKAPAAV
jgi:hypothetical protein